MFAMTVRGPVAADELGIVLPHEHLFIDLRNQFTPVADPEEDRLSRQPVSADNLGRLRQNPYAVRDNLVLDDLETAVREVEEFRRLGGRTIVDCTSVGIRRNVTALRELAERTGLHILAGCGHYTHDTHPAEMDRWSAADVAAQMIRDLREGADGTDIKAGVIGEIGTSDPVHANEWKALEAAALAHRGTAAAVYVHAYPWGRRGLEAAEFLVKKGVRAEKIAVCHTDVAPDVEHILALLRAGVFVEFDNFGKEFQISQEVRGFAGGGFARDVDRVRLLKRLVDAGYARQLLITNDICLKCLLRHFGGGGYAHILRDIVPMLESEGVDAGTIDMLLRGNPRRLLAAPV